MVVEETQSVYSTKEAKRDKHWEEKEEQWWQTYEENLKVKSNCKLLTSVEGGVGVERI